MLKDYTGEKTHPKYKHILLQIMPCLILNAKEIITMHDHFLHLSNIFKDVFFCLFVFTYIKEALFSCFYPIILALYIFFIYLMMHSTYSYYYISSYFDIRNYIFVCVRT